MHRSDAHHVRKLLAKYEAAEAAAAAAPVEAPAAAKEPAADKAGSQEAEALLPAGGSDGKVDSSGADAPAAWEGDAVLPWWLPPERIPAAFSGGRPSSEKRSSL